MVSNTTVNVDNRTSFNASKDTLLNHMQESHALVLNKTLHLAAFLVSGDSWKSKDFQNRLPVLWYRQGG